MRCSVRFSLFSGLSLALLLSLSLPAQDENPGQGRPGRGARGGQGGPGSQGFGFLNLGGVGLSFATLLGSPQIRTELKVTEEQGKKLDEILASYRESSRDIFGGGFNRDATPEERQKALEEMAAKREELNKKTDAKLGEALEKGQLTRLEEIQLQHQGPEGLVSERVIAALKLSEEQVGKIKGAIATRDEEMAKLRPAGRGRRGGQGGDPGLSREERQAKMEKLTKDADAAVLACLSKEQTEALAKLKGAAFELDRQSLFRGGFGGGRRGGGQGGPGGPGGEGSGGRQRPPPDDEA